MSAIRQTLDAAAQTAASARKSWVDNAKGLCILLIVVCHELIGLEHADILPATSAWAFWKNFCYTFQVPVFFFVSGLFADRSFDKCGFRDFLKTKLGLLAFPYVVWQTLQILIMLAASGSTNHKATPWSLLAFPLVPFMQFWFLYVLMMVLVAYALLKCAGCSTTTILAISIGMLFLPKFAVWPPFHPFCKHMIFFSLGLALQGRIEVLSRMRTSLLIAGALLCGCGVATLIPVDLDANFSVVPAIIGGTGAIFASFAIARWRCGRLLSYLGRRSLDIYVAHAIFAAGMRLALSKGLHLQNLALHIGLGLTASIVGPLLLFHFARLCPPLSSLPAALRTNANFGWGRRATSGGARP